MEYALTHGHRKGFSEQDSDSSMHWSELLKDGTSNQKAPIQQRRPLFEWQDNSENGKNIPQLYVSEG